MTKSEKFSELCNLSVDRALEIARMKINPSDPNYLRLLNIQKEVIVAALSTQARVDGSKLRDREHDKLGELLEKIRAEEIAASA